MPSTLKERVEDAAARNRRSLSAEIAHRIEESFTQPLPEKDQVSVDINKAYTLAQAILLQEQQKEGLVQSLTTEEYSWLSLWRDMNERQRRMALAMIQAAIDSSRS